MTNIYQEHGYTSRGDYIKNLAESNGVDLRTAWALADMLGPTEDFDGLVIAIEDAAETGE